MSNATPRRTVGDIPVLYRTARSVDDKKARIPAYTPGTKVLPIGHRQHKKSLPLPVEIIFDSDVPVVLRDGTTILVDIFRPAGTDNLASLVGWAPYGKRGGYPSLDDFPFRMGVPRAKLSGLERFEGPDPAYWCPRGYAIINPDPRGIGRSEGDAVFWGEQEGKDGADLVDWVGTQEWSNGKVGLTGNSWLAIAQYFIAAQQPKHLAAIAPWEGQSDDYRENSMRGGIPNLDFINQIAEGLSGPNFVENPVAMAEKYPLMNEYWEDKIPAFDAIQVPAYVVASWTNVLHTQGTLDVFRRMASTSKWLRVHDSHEWPDYYKDSSVAEISRFFDHYLLGAENGWQDVPRVRVSVLGERKNNLVNQVESNWPPEIGHTELSLNAGAGQLVPSAPSSTSVAAYDSGSGEAAFDFKFDRDTQLLGYSSVTLWVSSDEATDLDLFVQLQRVNRKGRVSMNEVLPLPEPFFRLLDLARRAKAFDNSTIFFRGPTGRLRASHRELDERATPIEPHHAHIRQLPIAKGEIVKVDIPFWPVGMRFAAGEKLRLVVKGVDTNPRGLGVMEKSAVNVGAHRIHTGGEHNSVLRVPLR